jgi:hypothetical protein
MQLRDASSGWAVLRVDGKLMSTIYNRDCSSSTLMDARRMLQQLLVEAWVLQLLKISSSTLMSALGKILVMQPGGRTWR